MKVGYQNLSSDSAFLRAYASSNGDTNTSFPSGAAWGLMLALAFTQAVCH